VCAGGRRGVQAAILIGDELRLSAGGTGDLALLRGVGEEPGALESERAEGVGGTLGGGAGARDDGEVAGDSQIADGDDLERAKFEFFRDGPAGDEADAQAGLDSGFDGLGGIEIHDFLEGFRFEASLIQGGFDDATGAGALFAHKQRQPLELRAGNARGFELARGDEDEFIIHKGFGVHAAFLGRTFDEAGGDFSVEEELNDLGGVAAAERELDLGMFGEKCAEELGQNVLRNGGGDTEGEFARNGSLGGAELAFRLGGDGGELVGMVQENFALGSERDFAAGAVEEADAEFVFEGLDLKSDRGLSEKELVGGFAEIEVLGNGTADLKAEVLQLRHGRIIHGKT